jgi:hypothetical protein
MQQTGKDPKFGENDDLGSGRSKDAYIKRNRWTGRAMVA